MYQVPTIPCLSRRLDPLLEVKITRDDNLEFKGADYHWVYAHFTPEDWLDLSPAQFLMHHADPMLQAIAAELNAHPSWVVGKLPLVSAEKVPSLLCSGGRVPIRFWVARNKMVTVCLDFVARELTNPE